ncbi:flagellar basal body-associated FliL family protein [Solidesulfovibrio sp. C21]|uniref:flagellar basal body-associated FliL family protein n=1 Tax=Solidesulfovibrio sp. C21 TaxID=3398613 RepID=UPI0039FBF1DD
MRRHFALFLLAASLLCALLAASIAPAQQGGTFARGGTAVYSGIDVNVADGARLARLHLAFEAQCISEEAARMAASPETREAVLLFLRERTVAELSTPLGKRAFRRNLLAVMNKAVGGPRVVRLYFLQFVIE